MDLQVGFRVNDSGFRVYVVGSCGRNCRAQELGLWYA